MTTPPDPVLPDYAGACLTNVVPALRGARDNSWIPEPARDARQIVLLVLDGLGWEQLGTRRALTPNLSTMTGGPITSVAPTTTTAALTSITTGSPPASHGILGYRLHVGEAGVLNVLRWSTPDGDARATIDPAAFVRRAPFNGDAVPVVTRAEFGATGFTLGHLAGVSLRGWRMPSSIPVEAAAALNEGAPFVYCYYDGVDKIAHDKGFRRPLRRRGAGR